MLAGLITFFTSKIGAYCIIVGLIFVGLGIVYHDGGKHQYAKDKVVIDRLTGRVNAIQAAADQAAIDFQGAASTARHQQEDIVKALAASLAAWQDKFGKLAAQQPKVVHDNAPSIDARMPVVTAGFLWTRDLAYHPEFADLSTAATPEQRAADVGVRASEVARLDGEALTECRKWEFNAQQWDRWYSSNKPVFDAYAATVQRVNDQLQTAWKQQ